MSSPTADQDALEEWRQRLKDAKLRLDFAQYYVAQVKRDYTSGDIPDSQYHFAHGQALRLENLALAEYTRVLHIDTDLTVNIIPDEAAWHKAKATDG